MNTSCQFCCFAQFTNDVQSGCSLDKLDKYKKHMVIGEQSFYLIDGLCKYCRNKEWSARQDNIFESIQNEIKISLEYIILLQEEKDLFKNLEFSLNEIKDQDYTSVIVATDISADLSNLKTWIRRNIEKNHYFVRMFKPVESRRLMDEAVYYSKGKYVCILESGQEFSYDVPTILNNLINEEEKRISLIRPVFGLYHGLTVQRRLYQMVGGNENSNVEDKIMKIAEYYGQESMVYDFTEETVNE